MFKLGRYLMAILALVWVLSACTLPSPNPRPNDPEPVRHTLTVLSNDINPSLVNVSPSGPYLTGTQVTLTAPTLSDYVFVAWQVQNGDRYETDVITLTVTQNVTIEVIFEFIEPTDPDPVDPDPVDPDPVDPDPTDPDPVDPDPLDPDPTDPDPVDPDPVDPDPVDPNPVDPDPVDPTLESDTFTTEVVYGSSPSLTLSSNAGTSAFTLSHETFVLNQNTTIEAPIVEGYRFVYWYDVNFNRVFAYSRQINVQMARNQRLRAIYEQDNVARLYLENNVDLGTLTQQSRVQQGNNVTLTASVIPNGNFVHWLDLTNETILSTQSTLVLTMNTDRFIGAVYELYGEAQTSVLRFDGATKTSYALGTLMFNDFLWELDDALIGSSDADLKLDQRSIRLRQGHVKSVTPLEGLVSFAFYAGVYGTDSLSSLEVYLSNEAYGEFLLRTIELDRTLREFTITLADEALPEALRQGPYTIRFVSANAQRVNLDQFTLVTRPTTTPELPTLTESLSGFPNNSTRYELRFNDLITAFSYGDAWEGTGCEVYDTLTSSTHTCSVSGEVDTSVLGEYEITYYAIDPDGFYASQSITKVVLRDASLLDFVYSDYYQGIEGLYGLELKQALRTIMLNTAVLQSYGDARQILAEADAVLGDPSNVLLIYNRAQVAALWDGTTWNREHVWPNSRLGVPRVTNSDRNIASDLHNLRAINPSVNSSRGNSFFDFTTTSMTYFPGEDRGDVARIYFYMVTKYAHLILRDEFADGPTYQEAGAIHGRLSTLITFHFEDSVDAFEMQRNTVISSYQGNRNPFIDYPHLVELIWFNHPNIPLP